MPVKRVDPHSGAIIFDLTDEEKKVSELEYRIKVLEELLKNQQNQ